jgi:arabinogalactan oligomer/maltooligosaccharide transport system permease protein
MSHRSEVIAAESRPALSRNLRMALSYLALFVFTLFALYPIVRSLTTAFRPGSQRIASPSTGATNPPSSAFLDAAFLQWCANTALIALAVAIAGVALASAAGYAISRFRVRPRTDAVDRSLVPQILPALIVLVPLAFILFQLGRFNSWLWVSGIYLVTALPFCVWQLKRRYDAISFSVEEAATLDGCSSWQRFYSIILPATAPAFFMTAFFSFISAWNDYVVAALVLRDETLFPLPIALRLFQSDIGTQWALCSAGMFVASLPVALLFLLLSRCLGSDSAEVR